MLLGKKCGGLFLFIPHFSFNINVVFIDICLENLTSLLRDVKKEGESNSPSLSHFMFIPPHPHLHCLELSNLTTYNRKVWEWVT